MIMALISEFSKEQNVNMTEARGAGSLSDQSRF